MIKVRQDLKNYSLTFLPPSSINHNKHSILRDTILPLPYFLPFHSKAVLSCLPLLSLLVSTSNE